MKLPICYFLCLCFTQSIFAQGHYDSALQHLKHQLPPSLQSVESEQVSFQVASDFVITELLWFEEELKSIYTQKELKQFQKKSLTADFPDELRTFHNPKSLLRLHFSPLKGNLLILQLEKLRAQASNPKISIDQQTLELWYLLFCFDKEGKIVHTFAKCFQNDPLK